MSDQDASASRLGSLDVVPMQPHDIDWVAASERQIYPFFWGRQNFEDALSAGYSSWVLRADGERVGYAVLMLVLDEAHLLNISVLPQHQGGGLGSALLQHLFEVACAAGASQMFLEVRASNTRAQALYERRGFSPIGRRKGYYPAADGREDALVLRCELQEGAANE